MKTPNPFIHNPPSVFTDIEKLSREDREREIEALRDALTYHNYLRSILRAPEISEEAYFALRNRLGRLEEFQVTIMLSRGLKPDII